MLDTMPWTETKQTIAADRATGCWTVMDHVDIAPVADSARMAVEAARTEARRALEARAGHVAAPRFRILGIHWEHRGEFVRCRAEVEALA